MVITELMGLLKAVKYLKVLKTSSGGGRVQMNYGANKVLSDFMQPAASQSDAFSVHSEKMTTSGNVALVQMHLHI